MAIANSHPRRLHLILTDARIAVPALIVVIVWAAPVLDDDLIAGMQAISSELYEAARSRRQNWQRFLQPTLPGFCSR